MPVDLYSRTYHVHLDRIKKKYGWKGGKYQNLMSAIIAAQSEQIANRIGEIQKGKLDRVAREAQKRAGRRIAIPDISEVLPARSVHIKKGAERGKLLTDALRTQLSRGLKDAVMGYIGEGKPTMQYKQGERMGRMNPKLVTEFEARTARVFAGYATRDPELGGVPSNVHTIAVTEVRSVMDELKHGFIGAVIARNPEGLTARKTWRHHPELSKEPRPGHRATSGKSVGMEEMFHVPMYQRVGTIKSGANKGRARWRKTGESVDMRHPHDPQAPIGEVACCNCEADYTWTVIPSTRVKKDGGRKLQGRREFQGLSISIENRKGSIRSGEDEDGRKWETKMTLPYGYILLTEGVDGDHVDCFIGPEEKSEMVYVVHTKNPETGKYDEDKVMLGFVSAETARANILENYDTPDIVQEIEELTMDQFKAQLEERRGKKIEAPDPLTA